MKTFKKIALGMGLVSATLMMAQQQEAAKFDNLSMKNMIKIGIGGGAAVPKGNAGGALGLDVAYQNLVTPGVGLGVATGYTHYFGRKNTVNYGGANLNVDNNDFGVVPVAGLIRIYPKDTGFYLGTDLGYGFIVGDDKVNNSTVPASPSRPDGGFYIKPEIGYHNNDWNFALQYQKVFTGDTGNFGNQKFNAGYLGAGISYNIPLGQ